MICKKCGYEFDSNFCPNCGEPGKSGLDLFGETELFDSIESGILSDAEEEYKKEFGNMAVKAGNRSFGESDYESSDYDEYDDEYENEYSDEYEDDPDDEYDDYRDRNYSVRSLKESLDSLPKPDLVKTGKKLKKGISGTAKAAGKGISLFVDFVFRLMKWVSGILMLLSTFWLARGFWMERSALGSVTGFIYEKNYPEEVYLIGAASIVIFALIQFFWIMSAQRGIHKGITRSTDKGRGVFGFALFLVLGIVSGPVSYLVPSSPSVLIGIRQILVVMGNLPRVFLFANFAGLVLCSIRKINRRL